jgi:UDP-N-acetylmuramoylalanine-D-glutamate ligase
MKSELIKVTPSLAEHFLSKNRVNRTISHHKVNDYANLMQRGKWSLTHQGIAFYEDDSIADGQHRLLAIIKARATVPMMVTYGLEKESSLAIDYHRPRSIVDGIKIGGF